MSEFRTYVWGSRAVLSVNKADWYLRWMAVQQYSANTWRRKAFKSLLQLSVLLGVDGRLAKDMPMPELPGMDLNKCLRRIARLLGDTRVDTVLTFPAQEDRGRMYATLFDAACQPIGFAKIASIDGRPELLEAEARALQEVASWSGRAYHVPKLLALETVDDGRLLLTQSLPAPARPYPCRDTAVPDFQVAAGRRHVDPHAFQSLSWWSGLQAELTERYAAFATALQRYGERGLNVGWAHGDLGPGNIASSGGELWIYDWEQSQPDAPNLTDAIGFFLGCRTRRVLAAPGQVLEEFSKRFLDGRSEADQADAIFSLAYRLAYGGDDIRHLLQHWQA